MDDSPAVPPKPREYFVLVEGQMHGPFTIELLKAELDSGELTAEDLVQVGGLPIWRPLSQVLNTPEIRRPLSPPPQPLEMPPPIRVNTVRRMPR